MRRARVALLLAAAAATVATACSPAGPGPSNEPSLPPPPTAAVDAAGQPIRNLCDLLSVQDFATVAGAKATSPNTSKATDTAATCEYGKNLRLVVNVTASTDDATRAYQEALKSRTFSSGHETGTMAGVDESASGVGADRVGMLVRRRLLVFSIELPANTEQGKVKLIQLSGILLERAHALGT